MTILYRICYEVTNNYNRITVRMALPVITACINIFYCRNHLLWCQHYKVAAMSSPGKGVLICHHQCIVHQLSYTKRTFM